MIILQLLLGFFLANMLGYGGGPASIPLMYEEIVNHYHWLDHDQFANMLALGNMLPGPIATKIAAYVGFEAYGWLGVAAALIATTLPSALILIALLKLLQNHRQSKAIKGMTLLVQPVIAAMMLELTWKTSETSLASLGIIQSLLITAAAFLALVKWRMHPALVIAAAFIYGGVVLPHL
ncbi:chromate transporter [Paenibacillus sp. OV219]|uniref:chromate transporter n=1 Tax=Paenibacillus sp. OV219 TaxID=1884377 RepID=UPI0008CD3394|nr:chromate transporter [Paenibacillus sp. OV219]SEO76383.1 chromate transporter [Paenibacillus sp. OV219]